MHNEIIATGLPMGNYVAIWKVIIFVVFFGLWAWMGQWVDKDTKVVKTNQIFWNNIYMGSGALILALWFLVPAPFIVELLMFLVIWATVSVIYILHRNARVPKTQTILTPDHIKWLLSFEEQKRKKQKLRLVFISVNDNELPVPYKDEKEFNGYKMSEEILHDMWRRRVSHAVMIPRRETYETRYVIDGIATVEGERPREEALDCITYLKAVAGLDVEDHRRPQEGSFFTIRTGDKETGWRISTSGSTRGEQLSLERIEEKQALKIENIGLHPDQLEKLLALRQKESGVILVSGSRGHGVTTTLYGMILTHDAFIQNIHTLEPDILADLEIITQHKMAKGPKARSGAQQLRSVFHADPDIVMVGECEEAEMAKIITKAARTGKKIYAAFSAPNTFQALGEWLKMVGDSRKVAESLLVITSQKLIRVLCKDCRQAYAPDVSMLKKLNLPADKIKQFYRPPAEMEYDKHGNPVLCPTCQGTGYYGRMAVFEILFVSDALRKLIAQDSPINVLRTQCRKERMLFLQEQALRKVIDGTTSIQEVLRITQEAAQKSASKKIR